MAQVVRAELQLEALGGATQRHRHHPGIVDQDVDRLVPAGREFTYRVQVGQIQRASLGRPADPGHRLGCLCLIAGGDHHSGAAVGQHRVKITCFTSQDPAAKKPGPNETLGESLIPARYANFDTSGLTVAVLADGNKPFELKLESGTKSGETAEGGKVETSESEAKAADEAAKPIDDAAQSAPVDVGAPAATQPAADAAAAEVKTDAK